MPTTPPELPLPQALIDLVNSGFWPTTHEALQGQNLKCLVSTAKIRAFAPNEDYICFYPPPFATEAQHMKGNPSANSPMWANHEIDPVLTLIIGDFGLGSDAPIALDYRENFDDPAVIRLQWNLAEANHWVEIAPSFAKFATMILD